MRLFDGLPRPLHWLYLGEHNGWAASWQAALGDDFEAITANPDLDRIADDIRDHFVRWIDLLGARHHDSIGWWITELAERNTQVDPLFAEVCRLELAKHHLNGPEPPVLVVCESAGLVRSVAALDSEHSSTTVLAASRLSLAIGPMARTAAFLLYFIVTATRFWIAAALTRRGKPTDPFSGLGPHVLVSTFLHDNQLKGDGKFVDRYLPHLAQWLQEKGAQVAYLPVIAEPNSPARSKVAWMRSSKSKFLVAEDWLKLVDYIAAQRAALAGWRLLCAPSPLFLGLELGPLLDEERWRHLSSQRTRDAFLAGRLPRRLVEAGVRVDHMIAWSENQVNDKALVHGLRLAFPRASTTWVQNTPLFPNLLNLFPTRLECDSGVVADRVVASGELPARILREKSSDCLVTASGAGLRYDYLHQELPARGLESEFAVLVALPSTDDLASHLLDMALSARRELSGITWLFKPHPDREPSRLRERLASYPGAGTLVEESMSSIANRIDAVVTTGSGTALEASALGLPVAIVGSAHKLTYDPLCWFPDEEHGPYYSVEQLRSALSRMQASRADRDARRARRERVLRAWFAPVTPQNLSRFYE
jgi:hypothetical protein